MKKKLLNLSLLSLLTVSLLFLSTSCDDSDKTLTNQEEQQEATDIVINSGYLPLPVEEYEQIPSATQIDNTKSYPTKVYLSCPPIRSQGGEGSCVSWGVGYAARSISWKRQHGGSYAYNKNIFSPEYIFNQIKVSDCSGGSYVTDGLKLIRNQGVCVWNDMPYTDVDCDTYPNNYQASRAAKYKISSYRRVPKTVSAFKDKLAAKKPIVVAGPVYRQFYRLGKNEIQTETGTNYGGHCYCVVGYNDNKKAFRVMNSWGKSWGTNGFGWVSYSIMTKVWSEAYVLNE